MLNTIFTWFLYALTAAHAVCLVLVLVYLYRLQNPKK